MSHGAEHVRLAIGVFDTIESLWCTVQSLFDHGFALDQFCVVTLEATAAAIDRASEAQILGRRVQIADLCRHAEVWPGKGNPQIVATAGPLLNSIKDAQSSRAETRSQPLMSAEHTAEIQSQVLDRKNVLIVRSTSPAQQRLCTRALLDQSTHSVKTYDFVTRAALRHGSAGSST